jgi:hypothetical protein
MDEFKMDDLSRRGMLDRCDAFVEREEFLRLMLGRRELVRSDSSGGKVRGLLDPTIGQRFLIDRNKLLRR